MGADGAVRLSEWPLEKVVVSCAACDWKRRYDRSALFAKIGEQRMPELLDELARRNGCRRLNGGWTNRCPARYEISQADFATSSRVR